MSASAPHLSESTSAATSEHGPWREIVRRYQKPRLWRAIWQVINSVGPYLGLWVAMYFAAQYSLWLIVPLAVLAGGFFVRTFIIFHDCTHGSFFQSKRANEIVGFLTGVLTFTSFHHWRWEHSIHHAHTGNLDRRGIGDVWTMTVQEYLAAPWWQKLAYRVVRNPVVLLGVAPLVLFFILERLPHRNAGRRERLGLHATSVAVVLLAVGLWWLFGTQAYLVAQLTTALVACSAGVWLFYVQHQFEDVYWDRKPEWEFTRAAFEGSSYYQLPRILQWFSGNIGFHHIHHLSPRIPNYELERAFQSEPLFQQVHPLTPRTSLKSLRFRLWDEENQRLTSFAVLKERRPQHTRLSAVMEEISSKSHQPSTVR